MERTLPRRLFQKFSIALSTGKGESWVWLMNENRCCHFCYCYVRFTAESGEAADEVGEEDEAKTSDEVAEQDKPPHDNYVNFDIAQTVLGANVKKEPLVRGELTHGQFLTVTDIDNTLVDRFCLGESLPPLPSMVNGYEHERRLERHSTSYSDFDDEEEDYPREVSMAVHCMPAVYL